MRIICLALVSLIATENSIRKKMSSLFDMVRITFTSYSYLLKSEDSVNSLYSQMYKLVERFEDSSDYIKSQLYLFFYSKIYSLF